MKCETVTEFFTCNLEKGELDSMTWTEIRLLGESVREIGVLILVFVPLDVFFEPSPLYKMRYPSWVPSSLSVGHWMLIFFAVAGLLLIYSGIKLEQRGIVGEKENAVSDSIV